MRWEEEGRTRWFQEVWAGVKWRREALVFFGCMKLAEGPEAGDSKGMVVGGSWPS